MRYLLIILFALYCIPSYAQAWTQDPDFQSAYKNYLYQNKRCVDLKTKHKISTYIQAGECIERSSFSQLREVSPSSDAIDVLKELVMKNSAEADAKNEPASMVKTMNKIYMKMVIVSMDHIVNPQSRLTYYSIPEYAAIMGQPVQQEAPAPVVVYQQAPKRNCDNVGMATLLSNQDPWHNSTQDIINARIACENGQVYQPPVQQQMWIHCDTHGHDTDCMQIPNR